MQRVAKCAPEQCVYIADNPIKDFISPNRLGWRTIRIRRSGGIHADLICSDESQTSAELKDLKQLPELLELC
jgi:putative hydrolase of the HAD superfamily